MLRSFLVTRSGDRVPHWCAALPRYDSLMMLRSAGLLLLGMGLACAPCANAANTDKASHNRTIAGEFLVEPPTLINLGFEWFIDGDDNRTAQVAVSYRKATATTTSAPAGWNEALPLLRLQHERTYREGMLDVIAPNAFAGSILDLEPDTEYECRFVMTDKDGVSGKAVQVVRVRTRPEPKPFAGGRTFHVYPHGYKGAKQEPAFEGLLCAYYLTCSGTDWATAARPRVQPGDTLLVHAGLYKYNRYEYTNNLSVSTVPFDGTYYLTASGTAEKPIAIRGAGDGEVIFDGNGAFNLFNVKAANYNYFEGLTIRNTEIAIWAGTQFSNGSRGLTVKRCRFENIGMGIYTNYSGSSNFYIADNYFIGRNDPDHVISWRGEFWEKLDLPAKGQQFPPQMLSYIAVKIYGPGHVIAYNYVANFHDGIDIETYGNPDGSAAVGNAPKYPARKDWDRRPVAIDFYNNYMTNFHDNPFETDGGMHNIRVMRNMMINSASHALCNQPSNGGPVYWIRNIAYHLPEGSSRLTNGSAGVLFYNNTILSETQAAQGANMHWRNNLMLGENVQPAIFDINTLTSYSSSDYNGFRPNPGAKVSFRWNTPKAGPSDFTGPGHQAQLETHEFTTLADFARGTGQDGHSVTVDYDVFEKVRRLDRNDAANVQRVYKAEDFDFRLRAGAAAIDKGTPLAGITNGFAGAAPDLGAIEFGTMPPHYGPRP